MIPVIIVHSRLNSTPRVLWKSKTSFQITVKEQPYNHPCAFTLINHHSWIASCFKKDFLCLIRLKSFLSHTEDVFCSQNMTVLSPSLFSEDPKNCHFKSRRCSTPTDDKYTYTDLQCVNLLVVTFFCCCCMSYSLKLTSIESVMPWNHLTLCRPLLLLLQSFPASGSFQKSQLFISGGQNTGVSASTSVLPMNIQDWFPLGRTGWISLQSKGLSRIFSNTTVQKHQFFCAQFSL